MSVRAVQTVLDARIPDVPPRPEIDQAARYGCSGRVLKLVLLALANRADDQGHNSHPGVRACARIAQCDQNTATVALAHLRIDGLIHRTAAGGRTRADTYSLALDELAALSTGVWVTHTPTTRATHTPRVGQTHPPARGSDPHTTSIRPVHPATSDVVADITPRIDSTASGDSGCPDCEDTGWRYIDENHVERCTRCAA